MSSSPHGGDWHSDGGGGGGGRPLNDSVEAVFQDAGVAGQKNPILKELGLTCLT